MIYLQETIREEFEGPELHGASFLDKFMCESS